ncbi:hypothetical protein, partial [Escherichia coli]|uniref:hypothetical protein n=1 Tax=Escherichia coli TaxID=562 RepID=UPI001CCCBAD9
MTKAHIIWGDYLETDDIIEELQKNELDIITVIDEDIKSRVKRKGDITYAAKEYVEHARLCEVTEFHYYIPPIRRKCGPAWKVR